MASMNRLVNVLSCSTATNFNDFFILGSILTDSCVVVSSLSFSIANIKNYFDTLQEKHTFPLDIAV